MNYLNTTKKAVVAMLLLVSWQVSDAQTSIYTPNQNIGDNTVNNNVKIGAALGTPGFMLDVNGDINIDFDDDDTYYSYNYHDEPILSMKGYDGSTDDFEDDANLLIGHGAGADMNFASDAYGNRSNIFVGKYAGETVKSTTTSNSQYASKNVIMGYHAGRYIYDADENVIIGHGAAQSTSGSTNPADYNVIIGSLAGFDITSGYSNCLIGRYAGTNLTVGGSNVMLGYNVGQSATASSSNVFIGSVAGESFTTEDFNIAIGAEAAQDATDGEYNIYLGIRAGESSSSATDANDDNILIGYEAAQTMQGARNLVVGNQAASGYLEGANDNVIMGHGAGYNLAKSFDNVMIGVRAGYASNVTANTEIVQTSTFVGYEAGYAVDGGSYGNSFFGYNSGKATTTGNQNTFIGDQSAEGNTTGGQGTFIGANAGFYNTTATSNTFLGYNTGPTSNTYQGNCNIMIGSGTGYNAAITESVGIGCGVTVTESYQFIFGDCSTEEWGFGVDPASGHAIEVGCDTDNGNGAYLDDGGDWTNTSDRNKKENLKELDKVEILEKINQLPMNSWNYIGQDDKMHIGPMAQDFHSLFGTGDDDISISTIDPAGVALVGIQQLSKENKELRAEIEQLKAGNIGFGEKETTDNGSLKAALAGIETIKDWQAEFDAKLAEKDKQIASLQDRVSALEANTSSEVEALKAENETMKAQMDAMMARFDQLEQSVSGCCNNSGKGSGATFDKARLEQNTPNPFGTNTVIKYYVPQSAGSAYITVATAEGAELMKVNITEKGSGSVIISASTLTSGTYFYSLTVDGELIGAKKMVVVK